MALMPRKSAAAEGDNNIFWTTMADLLLGLAIIFMTLFVLAMTGFTQQSVEQKQHQIEVNKELIENLKKANIDAEVDPMSGDIKISDLQLFEVGSYQLSGRGKMAIPASPDEPLASNGVLPVRRERKKASAKGKTTGPTRMKGPHIVRPPSCARGGRVIGSIRSMADSQPRICRGGRHAPTRSHP